MLLIATENAVLSSPESWRQQALARTGYYPPGRLDAYPKGLAVIHWDAGQQGAGLSGAGGSDTVRLTCRLAAAAAARPLISRQRRGPTRAVSMRRCLPTVRAAGFTTMPIWNGDGKPGRATWRRRSVIMRSRPETVVAPAALSSGGAAGSQHDDQGLTRYGARIRERFLGFVDSRPAPHMLVEWPVSYPSALRRAALNVRGNFVMGVNADGETDLCGEVYESVWGQDHNGDAMIASVKLCWMR